jgi:uncharacterized membrane protein
MAAPAVTRPRRSRRIVAAGDRLDRRLALAVAAIALLGVGIAGYLTYIHYAGIDPICASGSGGCHKVQNSAYAELAGIPVAVLGLVGYLGILTSVVLRPVDLGRVAGAALALSGFGFSAYLTYREIFTIEAICQWCVASAVLMTALAVLTTVRLIRAD